MIPELLIPKWKTLLRERKEPLPTGSPEEQMTSFLKVHGLKVLTLGTVLKWMHVIGMKYANKTKSFYVDGHEREDVVESRIQFCHKYLREWEIYCKRFVRLSRQQVASIDGGLNESDCIPIADNNNPDGYVFEVHEDRLWFLKVAMLPEYEQMERHQSIRSMANPKKQLVIIGQDESIFHQYLLNHKEWVGPSGERCLNPKTIGEGFMLSAFKSREFGFGHRPFTEEEVQRINQYRANKTYLDSEAAKTVLGSDLKNDHPIKSADGDTPFIRYLLVGKSNDGYWSSAHMAVQFEDVVDCCLALYGDDMNFLFLFDHSCGHDRRPPGALDAKKMNVSFGGLQPKFKETKIEYAEGYLGEFNPKLRPGEYQSFVFEEGDDGPFYLTEEERRNNKQDRTIGGLMSKRKKTRLELGQELVQGHHILERFLPKEMKATQELAV